jgi:hypothetical protein
MNCPVTNIVVRTLCARNVSSISPATFASLPPSNVSAISRDDGLPRVTSSDVRSGTAPGRLCVRLSTGATRSRERPSRAGASGRPAAETEGGAPEVAGDDSSDCEAATGGGTGAKAVGPGSGARPPDSPQAASTSTRAVDPRTEGSQNHGNCTALGPAPHHRSSRRCADPASQMAQPNRAHHPTACGHRCICSAARRHAVRAASFINQTRAHGSPQNVREPTKRATLHRIPLPHCRQHRSEACDEITWAVLTGAVPRARRSA